MFDNVDDQNWRKRSFNKADEPKNFLDSASQTMHDAHVKSHKFDCQSGSHTSTTISIYHALSQQIMILTKKTETPDGINNPIST